MQFRLLAVVSPLVLCFLAMDAAAQNPMVRASVDPLGDDSDSDSGNTISRLSKDGRHIAFESFATDLVANDTNKETDIFVRDLLTGVTTRVSVDSAGMEADGRSEYPSISADGRFVSFHSVATNLIASDTNRATDVFVHDRDSDGNGIFDEGNGLTTRVSVRSNGAQGRGGSYYAMLSPDGNFVVFASDADNLVPFDNNSRVDIFVHDRATAKTTRANVDSAGIEGNADTYYSAISDNGQFVVYASFATNLVANDTNNAGDIFLRDVANGVTTRLSVDSAGNEADLGSFRASISDDGSLVAFSSTATNLVPGDVNGASDIFVRDVLAGTTVRVSLDLLGSDPDYDSSMPTISGDGLIVVYESYATDITSTDTNSFVDVFAVELATGITESLNVTCLGDLGDGFSFNASVSADGRFTAFTSSSSDIVGGDLAKFYDVFVFDRVNGPIDATWSNYGAGWPGTLGIPSFTSNSDPVLGSSVTVALSDSTGAGTIAVVILGLASTSVPTSADGTLLVVPVILQAMAVPAGGGTLTGTIPMDESLCGIHLYMQALELDAGASKGLSFTPGLDLLFGG